MSVFRVALANLRFPASPDESIALAEQAIGDAGAKGAGLICFPECFVPGYRGMGKCVPAPDPVFLERAWSTIASAAGRTGVGAILGTERIIEGALRATALVVDQNGTITGFQDKVQIAPEEEGFHSPGTGRRP
jgi:predicted amidohydrolase